MKQRYLLDTSVFINAWRKHYPINVFPAFWDEMDRLIEEGVVVSCYEVLEELRAQDDDLLEWVKKRNGIFEKPTEETVLEMQYIMHGYPNYAALSGSRNDADPWVIAHARLSEAIVVTYEEFVANPKPTKPPKIPNVCDDLDIKWVDTVGFLEACGVVFKTV